MSASALLSGWGRTAPTRAGVVRARAPDDVAAAVATAGARGVVARGLGRAYGDAAQNAGGTVIDTTGLDAIETFDPDAGTVVAQAGVSLGALLRAVAEHGWFAPVVPGTRHVTLGGAVACDVHGKNHHADGAFCRHVDWLDLVTPDGAMRRVGPDDDPGLFWATAGGMGLTGVVVRVRLRLLRVPGFRLRVTSERLGDLDAVLARLAERDASARYSVAWIDALARGGARGRGIAQWADHVAAPGEGAREGPGGGPGGPPLGRLRATRAARPRLRVPVQAPVLAARAPGRAFNAARFRRAPVVEVAEHAPLDGFFHPLDAVGDWNRLYGRRGFVQYQCVVPYGAEETLRRLVEDAGRAGSFLSVLKRLGPGDPGPLSFPAPGWTLAVDLPAGRPGLAATLDACDERVAAAGGRVYLAKDARMRPDVLAAMYPRLDDLRAVRARVDPGAILRSDLARRLGL